MPITQSNISGPEPPHDYLIEYTQQAIRKQTATIERLTAEGHEVTDATKQLSEMVRNLAALKQRKRTGR